MKTIYALLLIVTVVLGSGYTADGQYVNDNGNVYGSDGSYVGEIDDSGNKYDTEGENKGYVDSETDIYDSYTDTEGIEEE